MKEKGKRIVYVLQVLLLCICLCHRNNFCLLGWSACCLVHNEQPKIHLPSALWVVFPQGLLSSLIRFASICIRHTAEEWMSFRVLPASVHVFRWNLIHVMPKQTGKYQFSHILLPWKSRGLLILFVEWQALPMLPLWMLNRSFHEARTYECCVPKWHLWMVMESGF